MPLNNAQVEDCFNDIDDDTTSILSSILNLNLASSGNTDKSIVSAINKLLSTAKTREKGLEFLSLIIDNCLKDVIVANGINWVNYCIVRFPEDVLGETKLSVIGKVVDNAYTQPDFTKRFLSDCMSKVLENCINTFHVTNTYSEVALTTLAVCLRRYPSWFGINKDRIEAFLVNFLDSKSEVIVEKAALCFHYLQQVGGAGLDGINHRTNFTKNFHKLCSTIHKLFDEFFINEHEFFERENQNDENSFAFKETSAYNSSQKMLHIVSRRLSNCFKFLEILIRIRFSVAKEIRPRELVAVITRGLAMHRCVTNAAEHTMENYSFSLLLIQIQMKLMRILRLFLIWYRTNILPFSYTISKTLMDTLNKTQKCDCFKVDCLYKEAIYKTVNTWLEISKNSFHIHFQKQLISSILRDITPTKSEITLNITGNINKSAKARKKAMNEKIIASGINKSSSENLRNITQINDINRCHLALQTLETLLFHTEIKVKSIILKNLYTTIFSTLNDIQTSKTPHPYTNSNCQLSLYKILVAFFEQDTLKTLPPLQLTLNALANGAATNSRSNRFIVAVCEEGLSCLEKLCQPVCQSLYVSKGDRGEFGRTEVFSRNGNEVEGATPVFSDYTDLPEENSLITDTIEEEIQDKHNTSINIIDVKILHPPDKNLENINNTQEDIDENLTQEDSYEEDEVERNVEGNEEGLDTIGEEEPPMKKLKTDTTNAVESKLDDQDEEKSCKDMVNTEESISRIDEDIVSTELNSSNQDEECPVVNEGNNDTEPDEDISFNEDENMPQEIRKNDTTVNEYQHKGIKEIEIQHNGKEEIDDPEDLGDVFEETVETNGIKKNDSDGESFLEDDGFVDEIRDE